MNLKRASSRTFTFKGVLFLDAVIGKCANDNLVDARPCGRSRMVHCAIFWFMFMYMTSLPLPLLLMLRILLRFT
jgi:hypothetical protein